MMQDDVANVILIIKRAGQFSKADVLTKNSPFDEIERLYPDSYDKLIKSALFGAKMNERNFLGLSEPRYEVILLNLETFLNLRGRSLDAIQRTNNQEFSSDNFHVIAEDESSFETMQIDDTKEKKIDIRDTFLTLIVISGFSVLTGTLVLSDGFIESMILLFGFVFYIYFMTIYAIIGWALLLPCLIFTNGPVSHKLEHCIVQCFHITLVMTLACETFLFIARSESLLNYPFW